MDLQKDIGIDYVDAIIIVDENGKIVYSIRYNPRFDECGNENEFNNIINKSMLDVFPSVNPEESTIINCLKKGVPVVARNQVFSDYKGTFMRTNNITIPIINKGKVLGAVELSKDITLIQDVKNHELNTSKICIIEKSAKLNKNSVSKYNFEDIITQNADMQKNIANCKLIANSMSPVLVYGETGTGKELIVQSIHNYSIRQNKPFVAQNCAALPETLFEALLFGTVKGAFTGAGDKQGLFEIANGGTLFLDEINSMPLNMQTKLLRVLQDGYIRRIGDAKDIKVDVRVISAMNIDPLEAIQNKQLREDLFYRLNVMSIKLLPLRERKEDIPLLAEFFIKKYNAEYGRSVIGLTSPVEAFFQDYLWPGNVRELQHVIEAAISISSQPYIDIFHLPIYLSKTVNARNYEEMAAVQNPTQVGTIHDTVVTIERKMIVNALEKAKWNVSRASKLLSIPRQTLQYKISKYKIELK